MKRLLLDKSIVVPKQLLRELDPTDTLVLLLVVEILDKHHADGDGYVRIPASYIQTQIPKVSESTVKRSLHKLVENDYLAMLKPDEIFDRAFCYGLGGKLQ